MVELPGTAVAAACEEVVLAAEDTEKEELMVGGMIRWTSEVAPAQRSVCAPFR